MKKSIIILFILGLVSMTPTRRYTLTEGEAIMTFQVMELAKKTIPYADNVSAKEASYCLRQIDSVEKVLLCQSADTTKK